MTREEYLAKKAADTRRLLADGMLKPPGPEDSCSVCEKLTLFMNRVKSLKRKLTSKDSA